MPSLLQESPIVPDLSGPQTLYCCTKQDHQEEPQSRWRSPSSSAYGQTFTSETGHARLEPDKSLEIHNPTSWSRHLNHKVPEYLAAEANIQAGEHYLVFMTD